MSWKSINKPKQKNIISIVSSNETPESNKSNYAKEVVSNPDFDFCFTDFSSVILEKGTPSDKKTIKKLSQKLYGDGLEDDDITTIEQIYYKNYKHLFSHPPEDYPNNKIALIILGGLLVLGAIILRISYAIEESVTLLIFVSVINFIASAYTFLNWPFQVTSLIKDWLDDNCVPSYIERKLIKRVNGAMWMIAILLLFLLALTLVLSYVFSYHEIVTDIVSILILGVSILNDDIIFLIEKAFENRIFNNGNK